MATTDLTRKISSLTLKDILKKLQDYRKQISHRVVLIDFRVDEINIAVASSGDKNNINFNKFVRIDIPPEALDKSIPTDTNLMAELLKDVLEENGVLSLKCSIVLSSDTTYTRLIDIPSDLNDQQAYKYVSDPSSVLQIPIPLTKSDFDISSTSFHPKNINGTTLKKYFLSSIPKKSSDTIISTLFSAGLDVCTIDFNFLCQLRLINNHISSLGDNNYIVLLELVGECTHMILADSSGPIFIDRLASIKNYNDISYNTKDLYESSSVKDNGSPSSKRSMKISKLDLRVLVRELKKSIRLFFKENSLKGTVSVYLSGVNSQHEDIVNSLGESLNLPVHLISPVHSPGIGKVNFDPTKFSPQGISRLLGLGLSLIDQRSSSYKTHSVNSNIVESYIPDKLRIISALDNSKSDPSFKNVNKTNLIPKQGKSNLIDLSNQSYNNQQISEEITSTSIQQLNSKQPLENKPFDTIDKPSIPTLASSTNNPLSSTKNNSISASNLENPNLKYTKESNHKIIPSGKDIPLELRDNEGLTSSETKPIVNSSISINNEGFKTSEGPHSENLSEETSKFSMDASFLGIDQDISESMASQEEITLTNESKDLVDDKDDATEFRMDTTFLDIEENND
ncbi:pilus assembly protein PilM [Prochlorococcus marinus]|uniref:Tfp pilus assembly protein, ATPase PilM n=1 Tax=Prochlorococcus marinus (strain MIT 9211) TaxID=93059 RepID=A9BA90_PROM4|nr:pilus assembly protein PilM [Prochlorococcus marinus]ABX08752.1 Tfp pilus assembly protein, ATPase PilM [Prochlorococcus marinus str. MIT 9211]